jgi:hypothetical protein
LLRDWDAMRRRLSVALLGEGRFARLTPCIATYTIVERTYAAALADDPGYALLLRDTVLALSEGASGTLDPDCASTPAIAWIAERALQPTV